MKKIFTLVAAIMLTAGAFAQAPQKMSYQTVIRDGANTLVASTTVGIRITVLQGSSTGTPVYIETHTPTTNANGLASLEIGAGTAVSGTFAGIDWSAGPYFIKTETDPTGGTSYTISGTSQLMSVPYALFAANGTPGPVGPTGANGTNGNDGAVGATGANGIDGATGATGATGNNGVDGATGATGNDGLAGVTGSTGSNGVDGATGATGNTGATGSMGPMGMGMPGTPGANGATGATGSTGATGNDGVAGATGATGNNGTNGATGATGAMGAMGPMGMGMPGTPGTNGATGSTGATGATGATGNNGIAGATGANGNTGATGATGNNGTNGVTGATGSNGITGATGATGVVGATGAQGPQGPIGSNGTTGATGSGYGGTSNSPKTLGTGPGKSFNTQAGMAYIAGDRIRLVDQANSANYMEGIIVSYSATTIVANIDAIGGTAGTTVNNWNISIAGTIGTNGSTGATGATGATGPTGSVSAEYAYVYNQSAQFVTLGAAVSFDTNGPLSANITHNAGSSFIFINVSGTYKVEFSASASQASQFSIYQNGVSVAGSRYGAATTFSQNRGMVIINVIAGDVIQLNNTGSSGSLNLDANTAGTLSAVNASILITKL